MEALQDMPPPYICYEPPTSILLAVQEKADYWNKNLAIPDLQ
jgi:hypothetical protein